MTYSAVGLPEGLSVNRSTGLVSGTIALGAGNDGGTYAPVILVCDGVSGDSEEFLGHQPQPRGGPEQR